MYINEETAQLILDAIAWTMEQVDFVYRIGSAEEKVETAQNGFIDFCKARGIEGVERVVKN